MRVLLVSAAVLIASVLFAGAVWSERGVASVFEGGATPKPGVYLGPRDWAVAHKYVKLGAHIRIRNLANGRQVIVPVRDRGPYPHGRVVDVLPRVALALGMYQKGLQLVELSSVESGKVVTPHRHHHHRFRSEAIALLDALRKG